MKYPLTALITSTLLFSQSIQADINTDATQIFNDAQLVFPQYFPSQQQTQIMDPWLFRYYSKTKIYLGVNKNDAGVYVLGGQFGTVPFFVGSTQKIVAMLNSQKGATANNSSLCDTASLPAGMSYQQNGKVATISTNGQCIKIPSTTQNICAVKPTTNNSGGAVKTGINVLMHSNVKNFQLSGLTLPIPNLQDSLANTKNCIINAPTELASFVVNADICYDITDQYKNQPSIAAFINPPVTIKYTSSSTSTVVNDCFATDAQGISDAATGEVWVNQNGSFVKVP